MPIAGTARNDSELVTAGSAREIEVEAQNAKAVAIGPL